MEYHEIANIFPMMADKELSALAEDIKQNGLQNKIILHEGKILDGRNRFQACRMAGIKPQYEEYNGADPMRTIISLNLRRRHLDESQRAVIAARVATLQDGQRADYSRSADLPTLTQAIKVIARTLRVTYGTVYRRRRKLQVASQGRADDREPWQERSSPDRGTLSGFSRYMAANPVYFEDIFKAPYSPQNVRSAFGKISGVPGVAE